MGNLQKNLDQILKPNRRYANTNDINSSIIYLAESIKTAINSTLTPASCIKAHNNNPLLPTQIQHLINEKYKSRRIWQTHRSPAVKNV